MVFLLPLELISLHDDMLINNIEFIILSPVLTHLVDVDCLFEYGRVNVNYKCKILSIFLKGINNSVIVC